MLKGARGTLLRYHPLIIVELVEGNLQAMGTSVAQVQALLQSYGYSWRNSYGLNREFTATATPPAK